MEGLLPEATLQRVYARHSLRGQLPRAHVEVLHNPPRVRRLGDGHEHAPGRRLVNVSLALIRLGYNINMQSGQHVLLNKVFQDGAFVNASLAGRPALQPPANQHLAHAAPHLCRYLRLHGPPSGYMGP